MSPNALEVRGLRRSFPQFTLGPIDITVPAGVIYGFVGPNGAGKTTTIDLIFGMGAKHAGTITVLGLDHLRDDVAMKRLVGYVGPDLDFRPWRRVRRAIQFVRGFHPTWDQAYCDRLLRDFHLDHDQWIAEFSFGARIKLALVLALAWRPTLLVLDEPTVGLDAISRQQVFAELLAAVRDGERTVFLSSHAISDLERFADHVGMIKGGRMLFEGATTDVVERYRMVDVIADRPVNLDDAPGLYVQRKEAGRWRVLLDLRRASIDWLKTRGVRPVADTAVSLEEVFVALGRD
jgi:ABC-2 type transport system ATP-binding protein